MFVYTKLIHCIRLLQLHEEACDKVEEVVQKYNQIHKPVYTRRNEIIKSIPDFWSTAVSDAAFLLILTPDYLLSNGRLIYNSHFMYCIICSVQFSNHPELGARLNEEDSKV